MFLQRAKRGSAVSSTLAMEMAESTDKLLGNCSQNGPKSSSNNNSQPPPPPLPEPASMLDMPDSSSSEIIRLNVGGDRYMTTRLTLEGVPDTRLSNLQEADPNYNKATKEWFFDRNPQLFNCILDYFRTDELHFPHNFCGPSIKKELMYWGIDESEISPCCWNRYREFEEEKKIFDRIDQAFESKTLKEMANFTSEMVNPTRWQTWRRKIYVFLEEPMSSKLAQVWTVTFLGVVLTSIFILCFETEEKMRQKLQNLPPEYDEFFTTPSNVSYENYTDALNQTLILMRENRKIQILFTTEPHHVLENIDSFCTCFFTIEFLARLIVAPNRIKFWKSIMNIIDVLCVLPMWIKYIMLINNVQINMELLPVFFIIMMLRVLRICRVLRMARHYTGVKILLLALTASLQELIMLLIFVFIVVLIFAVVIYYAEFFEPTTFTTIPRGYWWAIITLTTVGYGDMYPKSALGFMVGSLCALTGILATGLPVPIIANNFNLYYSHTKLKEAVANRKQTVSKHKYPKSRTPAIMPEQHESVVAKEASV